MTLLVWSYEDLISNHGVFIYRKGRVKMIEQRGLKLLLYMKKCSKIIWFFVSHGDKYIVLVISWTPHHFGKKES